MVSIAERIHSYPMLARPFVRLLEAASYGEILFWTVAAQLLLLLVIGQIGSDGGERDRTEAWLASGVDAATATENSANAGFSFARASRIASTRFQITRRQIVSR